LLNDGHLGVYEGAVVISNDSDLVEPIKIVINQLGLPVGVLNTHVKKPSRQLLQHASFFKHIRRNDLQKSQFPPTLTDNTNSVGGLHVNRLNEKANY
jgi:hypothetical protein